MNQINCIVWLLPIIFMIHDFEEIIMVEVWGKRYKSEINETWPKRKPFALNYVRYCQTPTFSIGVEIEFILFTVITLFSVICNNYIVWFAAFLGVIIHMVILHIPLCISIKKYVPGVITSVVLFIPSILTLYKAEELLNYSASEIMLASLIGVFLMISIIPILHKLMEPCSMWLYKYSGENK